jgi:hypothetical protein
MLMDDKVIHRLDERAQTLAEKLGVHASVTFTEGDGSAIEPAEPKIVLSVYHDSKDKRSTDFRPDQPNIMSRIEQAIPVLAQELGKKH